MTDYGASDTSTTSLGANQFPISDVYVPNTGLKALGGGPKKTDGAGKDYAPLLAYIEDGSNVTQGASSDAANASTVMGQLKQLVANTNNQLTDEASLPTIATNTGNAATAIGTTADTAASTDTGTFSLIALVKRLLQSLTTGNTNTANIPAKGTAAMAASTPVTIATNDTVLSPIAYDNTHEIKVSAYGKNSAAGDTAIATDASGFVGVNVKNANTNGSATSANSAPVVIASDQATVAVKGAAVALYTTTQTAQGTGNSGDLTVSPYRELTIDVNITANPAGTNPTIQFEYDRKGADGIYYPIWFSDVINGLPANPTKVSASIGAGLQWNEALGNVGRVVWTVGGTATPTYTFTPNVYGK